MRGLADVAERPVVVLEELGRRQAAVRLPAVGVRVRVRVDDEQVLPAVVVVVEPADPAAHHRLVVVRHPEAERALAEVEPDLRSDVAEPQAARARLERARRNRRLRRGQRRACACGRDDQEPIAALLQLEGVREAHEGVLADGRRGNPAHDRALQGAGRVRDHRRRPLVLPGLELEAQVVDPVGRYRDRPGGGVRDLLSEVGQHRALGRLRGQGGVVLPQCTGLQVEIGGEVAGDRVGRRRVELSRHAGRVQDRDLRQRGAARRERSCRDRRRARDDEHGRVGGEPARAGQDERAAGEAGQRARERGQHHLADADDRQRRKQRDLRPVLGPHRRDQHRRDDPDRDGVDHAGRSAPRGRFRVGDHEEEEDEDLGRGDEEPPEREAADRAEVPARRHLVAGEGEDRDPDGEGRPEREGDAEEGETREDREAAGEDHDQRDQEPGRHRAPPEVQRFRLRYRKQQEADDEPDVRGVEDVVAPERDDVLREQREGGGAGEDPPAPHRPPVAVERAGNTQHEGHAVPRQHRARGPKEHVLPPHRDPDLQRRAGQDCDQDLGDRNAEVEAHLSDHLQRDDRRREVEPRIADLRQQHRIGATANRQRRRPRRSRYRLCSHQATRVAG